MGQRLSGARSGDDMTRILEHLALTGAMSIFGFLVASVTGFGLAVTMLIFRRSGRVIYPVLVACQSIPVIAVAPLVYVSLGAGALSQLLIIVIIAIFPTAISSYAGFKTVPSEHYDILRSVGATRQDIFYKLEWPSVIPSLFTGLRLAAGLSVIGAVIGEITFGSASGIGSYIARNASHPLFRRFAYVAAVLVCLLAMVMFGGVSLAGKACLRNRKEAQQWGSKKQSA